MNLAVIACKLKHLLIPYRRKFTAILLDFKKVKICNGLCSIYKLFQVNWV